MSPATVYSRHFLIALVLCAAGAHASVPPDRTSTKTVIAAWEDRTVDGLPGIERRLPEIQCDAVAFGDVIDFFRDVSGQSIAVNWTSLEAAGIGRNSPITFKLRNIRYSTALTRVLDVAGKGKTTIKYKIRNGVIYIATADAIANQANEREAYSKK